MRILRIALRNYRGVSDRTVEFAPGGVTIVEGPNEIGKSSIAEAIDRIIEDLDSTSRQRVLAIKPVDRDVGPEVTIEVETGPYAFRYKKRFLRDRVTELEIYRPRPENHTGREAHERVQAILSETVDMALWKALRMQQGDVVGQAALTDQTSLSAALDRSAGESPAGDEEVTLFGLAHAEYLQYWTETGRRKQAVTEMERAIEDATEKIARIEEAIRAIEADVEASVRLEAEARQPCRARGGAAIEARASTRRASTRSPSSRPGSERSQARFDVGATCGQRGAARREGAPGRDLGRRSSEGRAGTARGRRGGGRTRVRRRARRVSLMPIGGGRSPAGARRGEDPGRRATNSSLPFA